MCVCGQVNSSPAFSHKHQVNAYAQSCPILCDPMDCSPPDSSVHEISQAKILKGVAVSFSGGSSGSRDRIRISCIGRSILYHWATWEAPKNQGHWQLCILIVSWNSWTRVVLVQQVQILTFLLTFLLALLGVLMCVWIYTHTPTHARTHTHTQFLQLSTLKEIK